MPAPTRNLCSTVCKIEKLFEDWITAVQLEVTAVKKEIQ